MPHLRALQQAGTTMSNYYVVDSLCCRRVRRSLPASTRTTTGSSLTPAATVQVLAHHRGAIAGFLQGHCYPEFNSTLNQDGKQQHYGDDAQSYLTDVLSSKASSFIDSSASSGQPFMLEVATFAPHAPYTPAPRYAHAAQLVSYPRTSAYDTLPANPPSWLKGRPPLTSAAQNNITTAYRERVEADLSVDDMIGHLEHELQATGLARNTYFVFSSDNGYHMGEYRLDPGKQTAFDTDIHVPLIVSGPGARREQAMVAGHRADSGVVGHPGDARGHGRRPDVEQGGGEAEDLLAWTHDIPPDIAG
jgi:N-acetylglucosamine-6-sulfatase